MPYPLLLIALAVLASACGDGREDLASGGPVSSGLPANSSCALKQPGQETSKLANGYTLISTHIVEGGIGQTMLVDMKGRTVQTWKLHGFPAQMLPDGSVLGVEGFRGDDLLAHQDSINIVRQSWAGDKLWSFDSWDADGEKYMMSRQHHDIQRAPNPVGYFAPGQDAAANGNTLVLGHKSRTVPAVSDKVISDDVIYEIRSDGRQTGFTWYAADHIDEMGFDEVARAHIKDTPGFNGGDGNADWIHLNAMSRVGRNHWYERDGDARFHPNNILISSRNANLLAIIDWKTGRIVWRVGPDYSEGTPAHGLGQLLGQHHAHIIPHGLPGAGNVLVFDNGGLSGYGDHYGIRTYSRVLEFNPVTLKKVWEYDPRDKGVKFFSPFISSAQRLVNGNTLISNGKYGQVIEVDPDGNVLWSYQTAKNDDGNPRYIYRAFRIPPEWLPASVKSEHPTWKDQYTCPE